MYSALKVFNPNDLTKRGFISVQIDGIRHRFYNGSLLSINCNPNRCKTTIDRAKEFDRLYIEFSNALKKGWTPEILIEPVNRTNLIRSLQTIVKDLGSSYSERYKFDLTEVKDQFVKYLNDNSLSRLGCHQVKPKHIEGFLQMFQSSGTYFMSKRSKISALFGKLTALGFMDNNPVLKTSTRKIIAKLNEAYSDEQIYDVFNYLKVNYPNLFTCAVLMYGTLLRPHREIRLLQRKHFSADLEYYFLSGDENKGGIIRKLPLPDYVKIELQSRNVHLLAPETYVFGEQAKPYNQYYFSTMWGRAKTRLINQKAITDKQTLYSIRHSASLDIFNRSQSIKILQQLLGHKSSTTSEIYLRSLGYVDINVSLLPELKLII